MVNAWCARAARAGSRLRGKVLGNGETKGRRQVAISFSERQAAKQAQRERAAHATASARRTIETEQAGLLALAAALDGALAAPFAQAVDFLDEATRPDSATGVAPGRVIVSGVGKSGHVGRKIAATLASTGTPAFFV